MRLSTNPTITAPKHLLHELLRMTPYLSGVQTPNSPFRTNPTTSTHWTRKTAITEPRRCSNNSPPQRHRNMIIWRRPTTDRPSVRLAVPLSARTPPSPTSSLGCFPSSSTPTAELSWRHAGRLPSVRSIAAAASSDGSAAAAAVDALATTTTMSMTTTVMIRRPSLNSG